MSANEWTVAAIVESHVDLGHFGVQVSVKLPRELTKKEEDALMRLACQARDILLEESQRLDPQRQEESKKEREAIVDLFPAPIFVVEIPNGYCSQWCCKNRPWFQVTTPIGIITIGWRKRVLSIEWPDSLVTRSAEELFPDEDTTKTGRSIHAWGYDKAREYIAVLLRQETKI